MRRILGPTAAVGGALAAVILMAGPALAAPKVSVSPATGLTNGATVTVTVSGYPANQSGLFVVECNAKAATDPGVAHCDTSNIKTISTDANGGGTSSFTVKTGTIGDGTCDAGSTGCVIAVAPASGGTAANTAGAPIAFAGAAATPSSPSTPAATGGSTTTTGSTPSAVAGGTTTSTGKPFGLELGLGAALIAAGLGAGGFALRRRVSA